MDLVRDAYLIPAPQGAHDGRPALSGVAIRAGIAMLFVILALMLPGIAIAALLLLSGVYLIAALLLAVTAIFNARREAASWDRAVQDDVADLARGDAAPVWPLLAIFTVLAVLSA